MVGGGQLIEPGGDRTSVLGFVESAFDDVAALVGLAVEVRCSFSATASPFAVGELVGSFGNDHSDTFAPQQGSIRGRGTRIARDHHLRITQWWATTLEASHRDRLQQPSEHGSARVPMVVAHRERPRGARAGSISDLTTVYRRICEDPCSSPLGAGRNISSDMWFAGFRGIRPNPRPREILVVPEIGVLRIRCPIGCVGVRSAAAVQSRLPAQHRLAALQRRGSPTSGRRGLL